jgi:hypothetical protein
LIKGLSLDGNKKNIGGERLTCKDTITYKEKELTICIEG